MKDKDVIRFSTLYSQVVADGRVFARELDDQTMAAATLSLRESIKNFLETFPRKDYQGKFAEIYKSVD
jgi:hypothetical protein